MTSLCIVYGVVTSFVHDPKEIFLHSHLNRAFRITVLVYSSCAYVGVDVAFQYSNDVLQSVGLSPDNASISVIVTQVPALISSFFALMLVEKLGRKRLMFLALTLAIIGFVLFMTSKYSGYLALIGLILITCAHHGGTSPLRDIIAGDVCPQGIRAKVAGAATMCSFGTSFVIVVGFPPLQGAIGTYTFAIFLVVCVACFAWFLNYMPETSQTPVDETVHEWLDGKDVTANGSSALLYTE